MRKFLKGIKTLMLSVFLAFPTLVEAHFDILVSEHKENVFVEMNVGFFEFETYNKINLLLELTQKLVDKSDYTKQKIFIKIDNRYTSDIQPSYQVGYGKFNFFDGKYTEHEGFTILIESNDLTDIPAILQIASNILSLKDNIQLLQKPFEKEREISSEMKMDTFYTVNSQKIKSYMQQSNTLVDSVLLEKIFIKRNENQKRGLSYYYQNGKFHFTTLESIVSVHKEDKNTTISKEEKNTLILDNIVEITGNVESGYLLFNTLNSFYYLNTNTGKVKGEFKMSNVSDVTRFPIEKYSYDAKHRKVIFYINDYDTVRQILFIPDSNFIYSNYQNILTKNIDSLLKLNKTEEIKAEKSNNTNPFEIAFYSVLCLVFALLILIWKKNKK